MTAPSPLFDRNALRRQRARAMRLGPAMFLHEEAAFEIKERLIDINRTFTEPAIVTGYADFWHQEFPDAVILEDTDVLELTPASHDLVIHAMCLHWANDPVGQLVQCRRALKPDGLLLVVMLGGQTLSELRAVLAEAEARLTGGLSPRIAPMAEIRDVGGLLQRAGLALPVADSAKTVVSYETAFHLMRDLRAMGEGNAMVARHKKPARRNLFAQAARIYSDTYPSDQGRIAATFEMIFLTGWVPDESQQKPLRPGSAKSRLADFLETTELGEDAKPVKDSDTREKGQ